MLRRAQVRLAAEVRSDVVVANAISAAQKLMQRSGTYGANVLNRVGFDPAQIRHNVHTEDLVFTLASRGDAANGFASLHGGVIATLADVFTTVHLWGVEPTRKHVSANFDVSFISAARVGDTVEVTTRVLKSGQRMAFTEFTFVDVKSRSIVAKGTHTKAFLQ